MVDWESSLDSLTTSLSQCNHGSQLIPTQTLVRETDHPGTPIPLSSQKSMLFLEGQSVDLIRTLAHLVENSSIMEAKERLWGRPWLSLVKSSWRLRHDLRQCPLLPIVFCFAIGTSHWSTLSLSPAYYLPAYEFGQVTSPLLTSVSSSLFFLFFLPQVYLTNNTGGRTIAPYRQQPRDHTNASVLTLADKCL